MLDGAAVQTYRGAAALPRSRGYAATKTSKNTVHPTTPAEASMERKTRQATPSPGHPIARLAPADVQHAPAPVRRLLEDETQRFGAPLNTTLVWAHHPALLAAYKAWSNALSEAALIPAALKYLLYVRVASLNGCPF
jgi:hypothetical protein